MQRQLKSEHNSNDAFVKSTEASLAKMGGRAPIVQERCTKFNAEMSNDGDHAQRFTKSLTKGLDSAFPVK